MPRRGAVGPTRYQPLLDHLAALPDDRVTLAVGAIATILGFPLPASSRHSSFWLRNNPTWRRGGWQVSTIQRGGHVAAVTFVRAGAVMTTPAPAAAAARARLADDPAAPCAGGSPVHAALRQGLLSPTTAALLALARDGPQSMRRLAAMVGLSPVSATETGNRLVDAGLAVRTMHPTDRRMRLLALTAQGEAAAALLLAAFAELAGHRGDGAAPE